jgi:hypothetical protein
MHAVAGPTRWPIGIEIREPAEASWFSPVRSNKININPIGRYDLDLRMRVP